MTSLNNEGRFKLSPPQSFMSSIFQGSVLAADDDKFLKSSRVGKVFAKKNVTAN